MRRRTREAGFTLTELMIVLVILGILAAFGGPRLTRNSNESAGADFVSDVARDLQRTRMEAVTDRRPMRVYLYNDRVDVRRFDDNLTNAAGAFAWPSNTSTGDKYRVRLIRAKPGVFIRDVLAASTPPATPSSTPVPTLTAPETVDFSTLGSASFIGAPIAPPASPTNADKNIYIYVENTLIPAGHPKRRMRIDVQFLTGFVQTREGW